MPTDREFVVKIRIPVTEAGRRLHVNEERISQLASMMARSACAAIRFLFKVPAETAHVSADYLYPVRSHEETIIDVDNEPLVLPRLGEGPVEVRPGSGIYARWDPATPDMLR